MLGEGGSVGEEGGEGDGGGVWGEVVEGVEDRVGEGGGEEEGEGEVDEGGLHFGGGGELMGVPDEGMWRVLLGYRKGLGEEEEGYCTACFGRECFSQKGLQGRKCDMFYRRQH